MLASDVLLGKFPRNQTAPLPVRAFTEVFGHYLPSILTGRAIGPVGSPRPFQMQRNGRSSPVSTVTHYTAPYTYLPPRSGMSGSGIR